MAFNPARVLTYAQMQTIGPGNAGRQYIVTDSGISQWIDDGTLLRPVINGVMGNEPPSAASLSNTQVNWSTGTITKTNGLLYVNTPAAANVTLRASMAAIPTPSACQIQGRGLIRNNFATATVAAASNQFPGLCVVMYESGSGKFVSCGIGQSTSYNTGAQYFIVTSWGIWGSSTSRTSNDDFAQWGAEPFVRLRIAGGTVFWEQSWDLQTWDVLHSVAVTTAFTTAPTHYGVATSHFTSGGNTIAVYGHYDHLLLA